MKALMNFLPQADILYVLLFLGIASVAGYYVHTYHTAVAYQTTVKAESKAALEQAQQTIITNDTDYKAKLAAEKLAHANDNLAALQQHNSDVARLRAAAARQANTPLDSAVPAPAGTVAGAGSPAGLSGLPEQAVVCQRLSDALAHDDAILVSERAERDAITGK